MLDWQVLGPQLISNLAFVDFPIEHSLSGALLNRMFDLQCTLQNPRHLNSAVTTVRGASLALSI